MAYSIVEGAIAEVRINYRQNSQRMMNVFHYRALTAGAADAAVQELQNLANHIKTEVGQFCQTWSVEAASDCAIVSLDAQIISPVRYAKVNVAADIPGGGIGIGLPQNVQLSITKMGTGANRHNIGRVEVPGILPDMVEEGYAKPAAITWLTNLGTALAGIIETADPTDPNWMPVILNRASPPASVDIEGTTARATVRVARRRTVGVGE